MTVANGVGDGGRTAVGRRESDVGAARINDTDSAGGDDIGDGQCIAIVICVVDQRINQCRQEI